MARSNVVVTRLRLCAHSKMVTYWLKNHLGCCRFLMALLLVGGTMNLYWIIGLAVYILGEKLLPYGQRIGRIAGVGLVCWGLALLTGLL